MNIEQAKKILVNGVTLGQQRGAYSLAEAEMLSQAVRALALKQPAPPPTAPPPQTTPVEEATSSTSKDEVIPP